MVWKLLLFGLAVMVWPALAAADPAFVQQCHTSGPGSKETSVSCTMTVTAGNAVAVFGISEQATGPSTDSCADITDTKSNSYTFVYKRTTGGTASNLLLCLATNIASGSTTFTYSHTLDWDGIVVAELSGVTAADQATGNQSNTANATSGTTGTTSTANEIVIVGLDVQASGTLTCGAGYTQIAEDEAFTSVSYNMCYKVVSSTGTQSMTWTSPAGNWWSIIATFNGPAAGQFQGILPWVVEEK